MHLYCETLEVSNMAFAAAVSSQLVVQTQSKNEGGGGDGGEGNFDREAR